MEGEGSVGEYVACAGDREHENLLLECVVPRGTGWSWASRREALFAGLRAWRPYLAVVALFVGGSQVLGPLVGWAGIGLVRSALALFALFTLPFAALAPFYFWPEAARQADLAAYRRLSVLTALRRGLSPAVARLLALWGRLALVLTSGALVLVTLRAWRVSIPVLHPFTWDRAFDRLDVWLHGGVRPWELAHAAVTTPGAIAVIDFAYSQFWFVANVVIVVAAALMPASRRSQRVLVTVVLQYAVIGCVLAILFSSAGPVYFGRVLGLATSADPYAPMIAALDAQLAQSGVFSARTYHEHLWNEYVTGNAGLSTGITAFPSLHVSTATACALAVGDMRWWAGAAGWAFVAITLLGSVYLGWHYAVDGYASIVVMLALWWLAGRITRDA